MAELQPQLLGNIVESKATRSISNFQNFSRRATAISVYNKSGFNINKALDHMRGIDFSEPIHFITLPRGSEAIQYMFPGQVKPGNYFAPIGTAGNKLGIYTSGRTLVTFFASKDIPVLKSTTAAMIDNYSMANYGWEIETEGGATQYFSPSVEDWRIKP